MALTDAQCKNAIAKEKQYRLTDNNGLSLRVDPNGKKYWSVRFTVNGQRRSKSIGQYPEVGLKKAREVALCYIYETSGKPEIKVDQPEFYQVAEEWFEAKKLSWSKKHIQNVRSSLDELYINMGETQIDAITAQDILKAVKRIEGRGSLEIAKRTLSRCGMVMKYAIAHGYRLDNPASDLVYALKSKKVTNLASLPESEMPMFLSKVMSYPCDKQTHCAIMLVMLTGVRVGELLSAKWTEFDLDERKWDIPEVRMKNGLAHRVPLTDLMIETLHQLRGTHNHELLFPHRMDHEKPMCSETVLQVIKRSGYKGKMTTHGFRALFSTVVNESNLFSPDAIERQLAHVPQNRIRSAYNRAQYWDERVKMMEWYTQKVKYWLG